MTTSTVQYNCLFFFFFWVIIYMCAPLKLNLTFNSRYKKKIPLSLSFSLQFNLIQLKKNNRYIQKLFSLEKQ